MIPEVNKVTKLFRGLVAIDNLNFVINQNEILVIIGPNGAGKTTIMDIISGLYPTSSDRVIFS